MITAYLTDSRGKKCLETDDKCMVTVTGLSSAVSIKLNISKKTIDIKDSFSIKATVKGISKKVQWSSDNKKVATVNSKGKVTGKKAGTAVIKAKVGGKTAKCEVIVKETNKKSSNKEQLSYMKFLEKGSFTDAIFYATGKVSVKKKIHSFAYIDTNGDKVPELYVRAADVGSPSYGLSDYQVIDKSGKYNIIALEEKLTGYYKGTEVKTSVSNYTLYPTDEFYSTETTYILGSARKYSCTKYASGTVRYNYYPTQYYGAVSSYSSFYSWFSGKVKPSNRYRLFDFHANNATNRKKYLK